MKWSPRFQRGRWIGRKNAVVAGSRGLSDAEAIEKLHRRASELHGVMRDGFWFGVSETRTNWTARR